MGKVKVGRCSLGHGDGFKTHECRLLGKVARVRAARAAKKAAREREGSNKQPKGTGQSTVGWDHGRLTAGQRRALGWKRHASKR